MTVNCATEHELQRDEQAKAWLGACPRIVDLIGTGAKIDPSAEAVIYLRAATDRNPVGYSFDEMMGLIKAAERWFRGNGIGPCDTVAILVPSSPTTIVAIWGAAACGIAEPLNLLFSREAIVAQLNAIKARILLTPQPGMPGGLAPVFAEIVTPAATLAIGSAETVALFKEGSAEPAANRTAIIEFQVDDVEAEFARLKDELEVVHEPKMMPWGNRAAQFRDPEGTLVGLYTPVTDAAKERFGSR